MQQNSPKLKILHVAEILKGGTASYMDELLEHQISFYSQQNVQALLPESQINFITHLSRDSIVCFNDRSSRFVKTLRIANKFRELLDVRSFDVVHIHGTFAGLAIRIFFGWRLNRPKFIYCAHGWAFDRVSAPWKNWIIGKIEYLLTYGADKVICISDHDYQSAIHFGIPNEKLITIKNAIASSFHAEEQIDWPEGKRRFLFVGRFDRQKGIDLFIKAMQQIGDAGFAYVIGDASLGDNKLMNLPENIKITGWLPRNSVQAYFKTCEVFVMPSRWEGFGLSALESMRAGRLVIAARVGGLPELIEDRVNGILVEPDSIAALVEAMRSITDQNVIEMGIASRQRFECLFTSNKLNHAIDELYSKLS